MNSDRPRFARARLALGTAAAAAVVAIACDMPSPEVVAPDGKNQATARLYGKIQEGLNQRPEVTKVVVAKYFPSVARGDGGPSVLFLVRSASGDVVLADARPANELARTRRAEGEKMPSAEAAARERATVLEARDRVALMKTPSQPGNNLITERAPVGIAFTSVPARAGGWVPPGINALRPDDINTIDVSKHAAGTVAPNAVSIVTITLKPGALVPTSTNR